MIRKSFALVIGAMLLGGPAFAQPADPHQPWNGGSAGDSMTVPAGAVAPGYDPGTRAANDAIGTTLDRETQATHAARLAYAEDKARYAAALDARRQAIRTSQIHYAHQRSAYDAAMGAWRDQVAACHAGDVRACAAPAPDPAAYY